MRSLVLVIVLVHVPAALLLHISAPLPYAASSPVVQLRLRTPPLLCTGEEPAAEAAEPTEAAADPADPKAAAKAEKAALREAIADLEARLPKARGDLVASQDAAKDSGENGYMLLAANFERFRQQARTELDSQKGYGRVAAVRALLPFAETFEALQLGAEADGEEAAAIHKYYGGIYKQSQQLLESWKVVPYEAAPNDAFDMQLHQTVERVVSDDVPAGTVIACVERGYKMGDEVVRLAKCSVSSGPAVEEAAEAVPVAEEAAEAAEADSA